MEIIILGMHRSGTSALAALLENMGAFIGSPEVLLPAVEDNPRGYWERRDVLDANEALFAASGATWLTPQKFDAAKISVEAREKFGAIASRVATDLHSRPVSAVKDPRCCISLPFWMPFLKQPFVVFIHRNPLEVARSLSKRGSCSIAEGIAAWEFYTRSAIAVMAGLPRAVVSHDELMRHPGAVCDMLADALQKNGAQSIRKPAAAEIAGIVEVRLHREKTTLDEFASHAVPAQAALHRAVCDGSAFHGAGGVMSAAGLSTLEHLADQIIPLRARCGDNSLLADLRRQLEELRRQLDETSQQLADTASCAAKDKAWLTNELAFAAHQKLALQNAIAIAEETLRAIRAGRQPPLSLLPFSGLSAAQENAADTALRRIAEARAAAAAKSCDAKA
jgi:hypothetical protein